MHSRHQQIVSAVLIALIGVSTALLFIMGYVVFGVVGAAILVGLVGWWARDARIRRRNPTAAAIDGPRPAHAPPDGHIRFTLVVEGLAPDRIAQVWADVCRPEQPASEELRLLFRNFTVLEGQRFRFLKGDPTATAVLLRSVLGTAAGVSVRTSLEPAAERTPPWN